MRKPVCVVFSDGGGMSVQADRSLTAADLALIAAAVVRLVARGGASVEVILGASERLRCEERLVNPPVILSGGSDA